MLVDAVSGEEIRTGAGKILDVCASDSSWAKKGQTRCNRAADKVWVKGKKQKEGELMLEACYVFKCRVGVLGGAWALEIAEQACFGTTWALEIGDRALLRRRLALEKSARALASGQPERFEKTTIYRSGAT